MYSIIIGVPLKEEYNFPDICPITGLPADTAVTCKASPVGLVGVTKYLLGQAPKVRIPISTRVNGPFVWNALWRNACNIGIITLNIFICIRFGLGFYGTVGITILTCGPFIVWQLRHPLPFEVHWDDKKMIYEFINIRYARKFMELNEGAAELPIHEQQYIISETVWTFDLAPFIWKWLGLPLALLFIWRGVPGVAYQEFYFKGILWEGLTAIGGGAFYLLAGNTMVIRWCSPSVLWRFHEKVLALATLVAMIVFVMRMCLDAR